MAYEQTTTRDEALIPNTQLEELFLMDCSDEQMEKYMSLIDKGYISLATAYASKFVKKNAVLRKSYCDAFGITIEDIEKRLKLVDGGKKK